MRTHKIQSLTDDAFFATVNQLFGGSSQLPTTAERAVIKSLHEQSWDTETVLGGCRILRGAAKLTLAKNMLVG